MILAIKKALVKVTDGIENPTAEQTGAEIDVSHLFLRLAGGTSGCQA